MGRTRRAPSVVVCVVVDRRVAAPGRRGRPHADCRRRRRQRRVQHSIRHAAAPTIRPALSLGAHDGDSGHAPALLVSRSSTTAARSIASRAAKQKPFRGTKAAQTGSSRARSATSVAAQEFSPAAAPTRPAPWPRLRRLRGMPRPRIRLAARLRPTSLSRAAADQSWRVGATHQGLGSALHG